MNIQVRSFKVSFCQEHKISYSLLDKGKLVFRIIKKNHASCDFLRKYIFLCYLINSSIANMNKITFLVGTSTLHDKGFLYLFFIKIILIESAIMCTSNTIQLD